MKLNLSKRHENCSKVQSHQLDWTAKLQIDCVFPPMNLVKKSLTKAVMEFYLAKQKSSLFCGPGWGWKRGASGRQMQVLRLFAGWDNGRPQSNLWSTRISIVRRRTGHIFHRSTRCSLAGGQFRKPSGLVSCGNNFLHEITLYCRFVLEQIIQTEHMSCSIQFSIHTAGRVPCNAK